jgi:hypothetical protein
MGNTANNNWPYPESTDLVKDGATAIENLADAIDTTLGVFVPSSPGLTLINTTSFSAVASQSVNDVFSATYENYKIIITISDLSVDGTTRFKLRVGGTDSSASYFSAYNGIAVDAAGFSFTENNVTTGMVVTSGDGGVDNIYSYTGDLLKPFLAVSSLMSGVSTSSKSDGTFVGMAGAAAHQVATSFTGFSIIPQSGTITGKVAVYGYNF